jgi:hypothetical protein
MENDRNIYSPLEVARIIGQPLDPRKPYPEIVNECCEVDTAEPEDYLYYFDVLVETEKIYVITGTGAVTQEYVTLDTPAQLSFVDLATPEYYIKLTDFASRKEDVIARKKKTINWALNSYESWRIIQLLDTAAVQSGHTNTMESGFTRFNYQELISMIEDVQDYGDDYLLIVGAKIDRDMLLWDWNDFSKSPMSAMTQSKLGCIGETPCNRIKKYYKDNTEATCESRGSVETTRRASGSKVFNQKMI